MSLCHLLYIENHKWPVLKKMHFQFLFHFLQSIIVLFDGLAMMIMMTFRIDFFKVFHIGVALFLQYTRKNIQYIRPLNNPLSYLKTKLQ